jgi:hypothetical protein
MQCFFGSGAPPQMTSRDDSASDRRTLELWSSNPGDHNLYRRSGPRGDRMLVRRPGTRESKTFLPGEIAAARRWRDGGSARPANERTIGCPRPGTAIPSFATAARIFLASDEAAIDPSASDRRRSMVEYRLIPYLDEQGALPWRAHSKRPHREYPRAVDGSRLPYVLDPRDGLDSPSSATHTAP